MALPPSSAAGVELPGASQDEQHLRITTDATSIAAGQSPSGPKTQPQPTGLLLFLSTHLSRGRLDAGGYNMLRAVLQMLSEISLLLFPSSHVLEARVMRRIEKLSRYIISTFHTIGEHIDTQLERARQAMRELPELKVAHEKSRRRHLKIWRRRLRTLHEPSRNDVLLYRYFLIFFDSQVHAPFLQLHREEPQHNSWQLRDFFNHIRDCLNSLQENIEDANKIVTELDKEFNFGSWEANGGLASGNKKEGVPSLSKAGKRSRARPAPSTSTDDMLTSFADFFDSVEAVDHDDDGDHDHDNSMNARTEYGIAPGSSGPGSTTPRVFTGSFDQLEESVKSLRLEQLNLTDDNPGTGGTVRVKDFALPTPCLLPSPATLLERREALSVREPTWEHGTSGGNVLHSRRPHDRNRAQTVDERGGGLDAWLAESPSPGRAMERISSVHSRVLHRQQTL